jgi:lysylphosphatidylglycerol synthetase-like protein (DUF2156 family)
MFSPFRSRSSRTKESPQKILRRVSEKSLSSDSSSNISDDHAMQDTLATLLARYGQAAHMGARDASYSAFLNKTQDGAIIYKVIDKVAIISGDPLCIPALSLPLLDEFRKSCESRRLEVSMIGASGRLAVLAIQQGWVTMQFGTEKILNPLNNALLLGTGGKRILQKCRQLSKAGLTTQVYRPTCGHDVNLESRLVQIYHEWRWKRNRSRACQAYITVFDMFALHHLMTYICVRDPQRQVVGFVALRKLESGFHIDPIVATADAPKGTTEFLILATLSMTRDMGITCLSLGWEPQSRLDDISGVSHPMACIMRAIHEHIFRELPLDGKATFHQKFHPDLGQDNATHIIYFRAPKLKQTLAMLHFAKIDISGVLLSKSARMWQFMMRTKETRKREV